MQQPQSQQYQQQQQQQQVAPAVHPVTAAFQQQLMMSQFIPNVQYPTPPFQQTSRQQQYLQPQQPQQSAIGGQDPIGFLILFAYFLISFNTISFIPIVPFQLKDSFGRCSFICLLDSSDHLYSQAREIMDNPETTVRLR